MCGVLHNLFCLVLHTMHDTMSWMGVRKMRSNSRCVANESLTNHDYGLQLLEQLGEKHERHKFLLAKLVAFGPSSQMQTKNPCTIARCWTMNNSGILGLDILHDDKRGDSNLLSIAEMPSCRRNKCLRVNSPYLQLPPVAVPP